MLNLIKTYLFAGMVTVLPTVIVAYCIFWLFLFLDEMFIFVLSPVDYQKYYTPGFGIVLMILLFIVVGFFTTNFVGKIMNKLEKKIVNKVPFIKSMHAAIKQLLKSIVDKEGNNAFKQVVAIEYPRKGIWSIGFISGSSETIHERFATSKHYNIFVPTTPNPTSGFFLFVPEEEIIYLNMSIDVAMKLVITSGAVTPEKLISKSDIKK